MKAIFRGSLAVLVGSVALFVAPAAFADGEACFNDSDCPGTACGDAVCNWNKTPAMPVGNKTFACNPAGSQTPVGSDGWCTTTADCKCMGVGATCVAPHCTFTKASDAPAGTGGTGAGGSSSTAGTTSAAGTATSSAGTATSSAGTGSTSAPASSDSGGCSISVPGRTGGGIALGLGLAGLGLAFARRRR